MKVAFSRTLGPVQKSSNDARVERNTNGVHGTAAVLGMQLQEAANGGVKIVDVNAASPAFKAGIKRGDEIISIGGFQGETYKKWIDGIGRVVTDAPPDVGLPIVVQRRRRTNRIDYRDASVKRRQRPASADDTSCRDTAAEHTSEDTVAGCRWWRWFGASLGPPHLFPTKGRFRRTLSHCPVVPRRR